jgi:succinoglycan biosynthesis protein ExoA
MPPEAERGERAAPDGHSGAERARDAPVGANKGAAGPTVTVVLPVLDEERLVGPCLEAVLAQDYPRVVEILVADGGSRDWTREVAASYPGVRVLDNPRRSRPAGLNVALAAATGEVVVRVDARARLAPDYVSRCVEALERSGAAVVGGPMRFAPTSPSERAVVAAMTSRLGAGPAAFRRADGVARFVDTVYLGAFRTETLRRLGGWDEWTGGNEDAELAWRAQSAGGVFLDPSIRSTYVVREGLRPLARQFYRYGRNRARTIRKHPRSLAPRQLAVPLFLAGVVSPWRRKVLASYATVVGVRSALQAARDPRSAPLFALCLPTMHLAWGLGFLRGLLGPIGRPPPDALNGPDRARTSGGCDR